MICQVVILPHCSSIFTMFKGIAYTKQNYKTLHLDISCLIHFKIVSLSINDKFITKCACPHSLRRIVFTVGLASIKGKVWPVLLLQRELMHFLTLYPTAWWWLLLIPNFSLVCPFIPITCTHCTHRSIDSLQFLLCVSFFISSLRRCKERKGQNRFLSLFVFCMLFSWTDLIKMNIFPQNIWKFVSNSILYELEMFKFYSRIDQIYVLPIRGWSSSQFQFSSQPWNNSSRDWRESTFVRMWHETLLCMHVLHCLVGSGNITDSVRPFL